MGYVLAIHDSELLTPAAASALHGQYANVADIVHGPFEEDCTIVASNAPGGIAARLVTECLHTPKKTIEMFRTVSGELSNRSLGAPLLYRERPDRSFGHRTEVPPSIRVPGDSNFLGWFDKTGSELICRPTAWSLTHPEILEASRDFERAVREIYREELKHHWLDQMEFMKNVSPNFRYLDSPYSTITINKDVRFPYHYDFGDFTGGLGNLVVLDGGNNHAGIMVMPEIRCAFLVRPGDLLFMDVHQLHGNLPLTPDVPRLTAVLYARQNINRCS